MENSQTGDQSPRARALPFSLLRRAAGCTRIGCFSTRGVRSRVIRVSLCHIVTETHWFNPHTLAFSMAARNSIVHNHHDHHRTTLFFAWRHAVFLLLLLLLFHGRRHFDRGYNRALPSISDYIRCTKRAKIHIWNFQRRIINLFEMI